MPTGRLTTSRFPLAKPALPFMFIGGLEKLTLIDYPGEVAAVIFTKGCNFRCHFCHNPMLVVPSGAPRKDHSLIKEDDLFAFLRYRKGKLDGAVISGGEPTLQPDLPEFLKKIKEIGYKIKLDTNGTNPKMLIQAIKDGLLDYIAMDLKAPLDRYEAVVNASVNLENIKKSIKIIMSSGLPYEFRTTLVPGLAGPADIKKIGALIKGAEKWYLQAFKSDIGLLDKNYQGRPAFTPAEMETARKIAEKQVKKCEVRGG